MKLFLSIILILTFSNASACMSIPVEREFLDWEVIKRYKKADLVILAEFKNIKIIPGMFGGVRNSFEIKDTKKSNIILSKVFKGELPEKLIIEFKSIFCGQSVDLNKKYLIYAVKHKDSFAFSYAPILLNSEGSARDFKILKEIKYKYTNPETMTYEKYSQRIKSK